MDKSISINGDTRIETYTFDTQNPIIAYLIIPKTIAENISQLTINGDYSTTIIESDPILLLKQNEYTPGTKKLTIETKTGNKEHTTILLPINLTDYETFTEEEKQQLTETIKQFNHIEEKYYTTEEVKQIIEEFAKGTQTNIELQEKKEGQIFLSETSKPKNNIIKSINTILENTNTDPNQNFAKKESIFETLMFILDQKVKEEPTKLEEFENKILIELEPKNNKSIPKEINLYLSEKKLSDTINIQLNNTNQHITPIIETSNEISKYIKAKVNNSDKNEKELIISIDLNENTFNDLNQIKLRQIKFTLNYHFEKKTDHNINIIFGKCEENIGLKLRTIGQEINPDKILAKCDNNTFTNDSNTLDKNNSKTNTFTNDSNKLDKNNSKINQNDKNTQKDSNIFDEKLIETLLEEFFQHNSILANLPIYTITKDQNISLKNCENGCYIQTNSNLIKELFDQNIIKDKNTIKIPFDQIKSITIQLVDSNSEESEPTDMNLFYQCNSPCTWVATNSIEIKRFDTISIAHIQQSTLANIKIQGENNKEFVNNFEFIYYNSETNFQIPNNDAMKYVEELKKQKKIISVIQPFETKQKIKIFIPQELKKIEEMMKTRTAPFLLKDGTTNPNKSGWCSAYATRFANKYFGLNYKKADAWDLVKLKDHQLVYRETKKGGITKEQFGTLVENDKIIEPGNIIGVYYADSKYDEPGRLYTHVIVYLGKMNKEYLFAENFTGPKISSLDEILKRHTIIDVIKPKK
jgi:hypothetical protein